MQQKLGKVNLFCLTTLRFFAEVPESLWCRMHWSHWNERVGCVCRVLSKPSLASHEQRCITGMTATSCDLPASLLIKTVLGLMFPEDVGKIWRALADFNFVVIITKQSGESGLIALLTKSWWNSIRAFSALNLQMVHLILYQVGGWWAKNAVLVVSSMRVAASYWKIERLWFQNNDFGLSVDVSWASTLLKRVVVVKVKGKMCQYS